MSYHLCRDVWAVQLSTMAWKCLCFMGDVRPIRIQLDRGINFGFRSSKAVEAWAWEYGWAWNTLQASLAQPAWDVLLELACPCRQLEYQKIALCFTKACSHHVPSHFCRSTWAQVMHPFSRPNVTQEGRFVDELRVVLGPSDIWSCLLPSISSATSRLCTYPRSFKPSKSSQRLWLQHMTENQSIIYELLCRSLKFFPLFCSVVRTVLCTRGTLFTFVLLPPPFLPIDVITAAMVSHYSGPSGTIAAPLNYLADLPLWKKEKPWEMWTEQLPRGLTERTNVQFQAMDNVVIHDVRDLPEEAWPRLDREGYQYLSHPFPNIKLPSIENIEEDQEKKDAMQQYVSIMTAFLRDRFHGTKAVCYDWRV